jgi:protein-glutamine gamma-glutamyltransferase
MSAVTHTLKRFPPFRNFQRYIESQPLPEAEESIPLRVMVQLLVFVGIAASDVAASTNNSVWAIPFSAVGASWGWYARHRRNILVKFLIAITMIVMLVIFLGGLITQAEETRLLLAKLLIQLQVLHSFDLPRRKDLGYSTVIGLILLGVAATLSQTMIFGLWLLLFLAIAVPVLILDHRSRLGIPTPKLQLKSMGIAPLPLLGLLVAVTVLGLSIFALLPRLPGFQLRNFPVSGNVTIQRQIPAGGIVTPGRSRQQGQGGGAGNNNDGTGGDSATESTVLPPLFGTEIDETKNVTLKPELVMRVRSQAELFWRVLSYDEYTGRGWRISRNDRSQIRTLRRQVFNYEYYVPDAPGVFPRSGETRDVVQTYTIVSDNLPNLIPAAFMPTRLYFPSEEVDFDSEGGLRAPGALPPDLTYTAISSVPFRDRTALGKASQRYTAPIRSFYLKVPPQVASVVAAKANEILNKATNVVGDKKLEFDNPYDKALYLAQSLKQRYRIQDLTLSSTPSDDPNSDLVLQFLKQGGGQPSHFVSTMVLMLRSLGIPARYMVGFDSGKFNPFTGLYEVMNTDAHSMVEVFFPRHGWIAFDPVPGRNLFPSSIEEDKTFNTLQTFWNWVAGFLPSPVVGFFTVVFNAIGRWLSSVFTGLMNWLINLGWTGFIVGALIVFSAILGLWGAWQVIVWGLDLLRLRRLEPTQRTYQLMLRFLSERGMSKSPHQTPQEYALQVTSRVQPHQARAILEITQVYQDWRYGNRAANWRYLRSLLTKLRQRPSLKN